MKHKVLFFSRSFLSKYFAGIDSNQFEDYHVALTIEEKKYLRSKGKNVCGCFEEEYESLIPQSFPSNYLKTSFYSDRFLIRFDHKKRMEILGKEIAFWKCILEKEKPDIIVNETVAIEISEVLAIEAKRLNIKLLSFLGGITPYTFYWKPNPFHGSLYDLSVIKPSEEEKSKALTYYNSVVEENYKPIYAPQNSTKVKRASIKTLIGTIYRDIGLLFFKIKLKHLNTFQYEDKYSYNPFHKTQHAINRYLHKYNTKEDLEDKEVLFFPLHYEPEATLFHFAEEYQNQANTIEKIVRAAKLNQFIAVKEHPQQKGALLDKKYRLLKKAFSNLLLLPAELPSQDVIRKSKAVVTLTSTAAWEALLIGKPVFVLGKIFFDQSPGAIKVNDYEHLKMLLRKDVYHKPKRRETIEFIAKMISVSSQGYPSPYYTKNFDQNISDFTKSIEKMLVDL